MFKLFLCVFLGSGIGGAARYGISLLVNKFVGSSLFPWATFSVNVLGCFLIGLIYGAIDSSAISVSPETKAFLTAGLCGGLTTFSTFTNENYILFQSHDFGMLLLYVAVSVIVGFAAAWLAHSLFQ